MTSTPEPDDHGLGLFDDLEVHVSDGPTGGGLVGVGDPKIVAVVLGSLAVVALMVMVLSVVNNGVLSVFTALMLVITAGLAWAAARFARRA